MKKTLQDQYLLIKEGKGHKGVFLADAKREFPQYVPNAASFDEAIASLKTKNIISENVIGLSVTAGYEPKKKESYETAFESFLAEARKKDQEEKEKAELKKPSKQVEEDLDKQYDKEDDKNPDNMIFGQIMMGYYTEMKDPKNTDKTMQQVKDIVLKNLSKDPIFYTKEGQFGVKGLGYTTEAPGLGEPKEAKGKWKSSGYGDLKESKEIEDFKASVKKAFSEKPDKKFTPEEIEAKLNQLYPGRAERKKDTPEESKLREIIREIVDSELKEVLSTNEFTVSENIVSNLRESVEKDLADINKEAEHEVLQSKLDKIDALIDHKRSKLSKLDEDEDMKALTDKKKVKELEKDIKKLEVARNKVEKMMSKFKGKKSSDKKVIDETEEDLDVDAEYVEDATERLDAGQKVDSIVDTYSNLGMDQKEDLGNYLNYEASDDLKSDYVY
jgi:hypothetical protein